MKRFGKIMLCLLMAALTCYLFLVDYPKLMRSLSSSSRDTYAESSLETDETEQQEALIQQEETGMTEEQIAELEAELEQIYQQCESVSVALCFEQIGEAVYDDLYPALSEHGETGTLVFTNGWLTGDNGRIQTRDFRAMIAEGWSCAVGGDESLELTGTEEEAVATWQASLEEYLARIQVRTGITPTIYCFREGEYQSACDGILEEQGFTALLYSPEDADNDGNDSSSLQKIVRISLAEGAQAEDVLEALQGYSGAVLVTQIVDADEIEEAGQITLESYLSLLEELRGSDAISVTTLDAAIEAAADEEQSALRAEIREKESALAEARAQSVG